MYPVCTSEPDSEPQPDTETETAPETEPHSDSDSDLPVRFRFRPIQVPIPVSRLAAATRKGVGSYSGCAPGSEATRAPSPQARARPARIPAAEPSARSDSTI